MNEEPHIWTSRGHVLLSALEYSTHWQDSPTETVFVEEHRTKDGEIIRRAVHVLKRAGATSIIEQGAING